MHRLGLNIVSGLSMLALPLLSAAPGLAYDYGPDTCVQGLVWREAYPGDHVCVRPWVRTEAARDNAAARHRAFWTGRCLPGLVWRQANPADHLCVPPVVRAMTAAQNEGAFLRFKRNAPGPDDRFVAHAPPVPPVESAEPSAAAIPLPAPPPPPAPEPAAFGPPAADPAVSRPAPAKPERRIALVIGNAHYARVGILANPLNDAHDFAQTLQAAGFDVTQKDDLSREGLIDALAKFADAATTADWAVVYFSGHGIEMAGANYLVPVDARLLTDTSVGFEAVPLAEVMAAVAGARKLRLVILDACRSNPFAAHIS